MCYRLFGSVLVCLFSASIFVAKFSANVSDLRITESATKFSLRKEGEVVSTAKKTEQATGIWSRIQRSVDLSSILSRGNNRVEIRRSGEAARASAKVVETHYEPWSQGAAERAKISFFAIRARCDSP